MKDIKVSILCLSYNHAKYLRQTLDGFLAQKTDFAFEILINDDASTDGTVEIIEEYKKTYPEVIKPVFQKENQYSKGLRNFMIRFLIPKAKGKYLALCEGDDYWVDSLKLQKQVDFMDAHPDHALCFHPVNVIYEDKSRPDEVFPKKRPTLTVKNLLKGNFIQTNSVFYRRQEKYEGMNLNAMPADWYLHLYHAQFGKIGFTNQVMSVYRRHPGGIWWSSLGDGTNFWKEYGVPHMLLYAEMLRMYGNNEQDRQIIEQKITDGIAGFVAIEEGAVSILQQIAQKTPELVPYIIQTLYVVMFGEKEDVRSELGEAREEINRLRTQLDLIRSSRAWKIRNKLAKIFGKEQV